MARLRAGLATGLKARPEEGSRRIGPQARPKAPWKVDAADGWLDSLATILVVVVFGLGWGLLEGLGWALVDALEERPPDTMRAAVAENRYLPDRLAIRAGMAMASTGGGPSREDPLLAHAPTTTPTTLSSLSPDERGARTRRWIALETRGSRP